MGKILVAEMEVAGAGNEDGAFGIGSGVECC